MTSFSELLGSEVLSEDVKSKLAEAFESKIAEAREELTATLREEFSQRYEHDKGLLVDAMDQMIGEAIEKELVEFQQDKEALAEARINYANNVAKHSELLNKFVMEALAREIKELRNDREANKQNMAQLEEFVLKRLTNELNELHEDEQALRSARVRLVQEGKKTIAQAKEKFVKEAAGKVEGIISKSLKTELSQLKEDIKVARENAFGRKIMETFAAEFMASHFADGMEVKKVSKQLAEVQIKLEETKKQLDTKDNMIAESVRKVAIAEDVARRTTIMQELVAPLSKEKREIMSDLLKTVKTERLKESFEKYLPAVLNETVKSSEKKATLVESTGSQSTAITGNKKQSEETGSKADIITLKKLAGI